MVKTVVLNILSLFKTSFFIGFNSVRYAYYSIQPYMYFFCLGVFILIFSQLLYLLEKITELKLKG